jgi:hypothetical protein
MKEACRLEDWGIKFQNVYQTLAKRRQAINGEQAKLDSVKQINMATRQFMGQGRQGGAATRSRSSGTCARTYEQSPPPHAR